MWKHTVETLVLGSIGMAVGAVCTLAIRTSNARSPAPHDAFSVSIQEKAAIRSARQQWSEHIYNCRASAESCAIAAVQEACGRNEYEITFENIRVLEDGQLDGEWGYRCLIRENVL